MLAGMYIVMFHWYSDLHSRIPSAHWHWFSWWGVGRCSQSIWVCTICCLPFAIQTEHPWFGVTTKECMGMQPSFCYKKKPCSACSALCPLGIAVWLCCNVQALLCHIGLAHLQLATWQRLNAEPVVSTSGCKSMQMVQFAEHNWRTWCEWCGRTSTVC